MGGIILRHPLDGLKPSIWDCIVIFLGVCVLYVFIL